MALNEFNLAGTKVDISDEGVRLWSKEDGYHDAVLIKHDDFNRISRMVENWQQEAISHNNDFVRRLLAIGYIERYKPDDEECGGILCIVSSAPFLTNPSSGSTRLDHIRGYHNGSFIGATDEAWPFVFLVDNNGNPVDASYYKNQIAELIKK